MSLREVTVCRAGPMCSAAGCVIIRRGTRAPPYGVQGCSLVGRDLCVPPRIRIDSVGAMWASPPTRSQGLRADGRTGSSAPTKRDVVSQGQLFRRVSSPTRDVKKRTALPRLLIRKHEKVSKINVFKGREHGTKSKNLILTGTKGADVKISALFLSPRHRQPPYGVFSYSYLYPPEKCIN